MKDSERQQIEYFVGDQGSLGLTTRLILEVEAENKALRERIEALEKTVRELPPPTCPGCGGFLAKFREADQPAVWTCPACFDHAPKGTSSLKDAGTEQAEPGNSSP